MKIKDFCIFCKTLGKQLNFIFSLGVLSSVLFFLTNYLENVGALDSLTAAIFKGSTIFLTAFYFGYCLVLIKKIIDKFYR